jgi:signal transduction histidine kinase
MTNISLRRRLFVWLSASILTAGLLAAALSFYLSYEDANELQDAQLTQVAGVLSHNALSDSAIDYKPRNNEDAETHYVIKRLGSLPPNPDPQVDLPLPESLSPGLQTIDQRGVRWRALVTQSAGGQRFAVAQRMTVRDEVARDSALLTLLPLLVLVPVLLMIVGLVLRRAFAPMRVMSREVDQLDGNQLVALDERHVPLETLPLVQAVNRLMRRLALALDQQRRLVSDAAHELRTPVATLIVQADNVQHVDLSPTARARMAALRQGLARMSSLIDQLLDFARVQGAASMTQRLELDALVRTAIEETLPLAQAKGVDLGSLRNDSVAIVGDPLHAYALVRNAIDNAVRYTPSGGTVDVSVAIESGVAYLVVEDTGPGIADADLDRVFEPFVRVLGSQESGSGLGLAIARTAAQALGGDIRLGKRADQRSGLRFVYRQAAS